MRINSSNNGMKVQRSIKNDYKGGSSLHQKSVSSKVCYIKNSLPQKPVTSKVRYLKNSF